MPLQILRGLLMNRSESRLLNRPRLTALVLVTAGVLGLLAACSSDGGNSAPSTPPPITTGGGGSGGAGSGDAGDDSSGGNAPGAGASSRAGSSNGGGSNGGSGPISDGGEGGELSGDAGAPPVSSTCPKTDLGFLNAPTPATIQKSHFDNLKRLGLGPTDTLPPLN